MEYFVYTCVTNLNLMNCSGLNLTDCPPLNNNITELILDNNLLNNLNTTNCQKWSQLRKLSVAKNKLKIVPKFDQFLSLEKLYLGNNQIENVTINSRSLVEINISNNKIISITIEPSSDMLLEVLKISFNQIDTKNFGKLLDNLHKAPFFSILDISYNNLDSFTVSMMSFTANYLKSMNFSGNKFKNIDFEYFSSFNKPGYSIDFSHNLISDWSINQSLKIGFINFTSNQLSKIDINKIKQFQDLKGIDLSNNPLNCLCNESATFINWVKEHKKLFLNLQQTKCKNNINNTRIIDIICQESTTSSTLISSTKNTLSTSHSIISTTAKSDIDKKDKFWKIAVGVIVPPLIIGILLVFWILCRRHRYRGYQSLNDSSSPSFTFACDCIPLLPYSFQRDRSTISINPEETTRVSFNDQHLSFEKTLNILCSVRDTKWIKENIADYLEINKQFVDNKVSIFPYTDYTLIVINGDNCLRDNIFINNVQKAIQDRNKDETKLLINEWPSLNQDTPVINYIKLKRRQKQFFKFDENNKNICVTALKLWLNLDVVPHYV